MLHFNKKISNCILISILIGVFTVYCRNNDYSKMYLESKFFDFLFPLLFYLSLLRYRSLKLKQVSANKTIVTSFTKYLAMHSKDPFSYSLIIFSLTWYIWHINISQSKLVELYPLDFYRTQHPKCQYLYLFIWALFYHV